MSAQSGSQANAPSASARLLQKMKGSLSSNSQQLLTQSWGQQPVSTDDQALIQQPAPQAAPVTEVMEPAQPVQPAEEVIAQAVPQVVAQATDTLNPPDVISGSAKEAPLINITVERPAVDAIPGLQDVELEKQHELPPEVEGFLQTVEDHQEQIPHEIVIADSQSGQALPRVMAQPVIVLPITPEIEEDGKKKPPNFSVRWLIEWSWKVMKVFSGKVVYRKTEA